MGFPNPRNVDVDLDLLTVHQLVADVVQVNTQMILAGPIAAVAGVRIDNVDVSVHDHTGGAGMGARIPRAGLTDGSALSVVARSANSPGALADLAASADSGAVFRESGSVIGWGTVAAAGLASDAVTTDKILNSNVTLAKIANGTALSVLGVAGSSGAAYADIVAATASTVLKRNASSALEFAKVLVVDTDFSGATSAGAGLPVGVRKLYSAANVLAGNSVVSDSYFATAAGLMVGTIGAETWGFGVSGYSVYTGGNNDQLGARHRFDTGDVQVGTVVVVKGQASSTPGALLPRTISAAGLPNSQASLFATGEAAQYVNTSTGFHYFSYKDSGGSVYSILLAIV
jgi:hypothetical protein